MRKLAFGPEKDYVRHFGYYVSLVDLPNDRDWQRGMLNVPGLTIAVRDAGDGPQGMMLAASDELDYDYRDLDAQRRIIDGFLARVDAWQVPALRAAFTDRAARGFYFDSVEPDPMPSWIRRRHGACIADVPRAAAPVRRALSGVCAGRCADHGAADAGGARRAQCDVPGVRDQVREMN